MGCGADLERFTGKFQIIESSVAFGVKRVKPVMV